MLLMGKCVLKILRCSLDFFSAWRKCQAVTETTVVPASPYNSELNASKCGVLRVRLTSGSILYLLKFTVCLNFTIYCCYGSPSILVLLST